MSAKNLIAKLVSYPKICAFVLGWISVYALPPFYIFPILFLSFSGLFLLLTKTADTPGKAWKLGYFFGFGHFAFGLSWIGNALLLDIATLGWLYPLCLLAGGAFFGLFTAVPLWLSFYFSSLTAKILAFAGFWGISEWLRSFILTGFPWNLLGSVFAFSDTMLQTASIWGTYGLSVITILISSFPALYLCTPQKKKLLPAIGVPILLFFILSGFGLLRLQNASVQPGKTAIRIVQPSIPQKMKWDSKALEENLQKYIDLSRSPGLDKIDFVVWGETAVPFPLDIDTAHRRAVTRAIPDNGYLITGAVRYEESPDGRYIPYNSMFIIDKSGTISAGYDKSHLVPFGEYIPLRQYLPDWIRPVTNTIADFHPGSGPQNIKIGAHPQLNVTICYEIIFPHQIVNLQKKPSWMVNLTNDGWYGDSMGPYQHLTATRLRAVEEGITIIRAANSGISAAISPYGQIISEIPLNIPDFTDLYLPQTAYVFTFYNKYGNRLPVALCIFNILLAGYISRKNNKSEKRDKFINNCYISKKQYNILYKKFVDDKL